MSDRDDLSAPSRGAHFLTPRSWAWWWLRMTLPRLALALMPGVVVYVFAVLQLDAIVDWGAVREELATWPRWRVAAVVYALAIAFGQGLRAPIRGAWSHGSVGWLWRLPHRPAVAGALVWVLSALALLPWGATLGLDPIAGLATWGWAGLALAAASVASRAMVPVMMLGSAGLVASVFGGLYTLPAVLLLPAALFKLGRSCDRTRTRGEAGARTTHPWARGPTTGLVRLELLALRRRSPATLVMLLLAGPALAAGQTAARVNGPNVGWSATRAGVLALVLLSPVVASAMSVVVRDLGRSFDRSSWPVSVHRRLTGSLLTIMALWAPALLGLRLGGAGGALGNAHLVGVAFALGGGSLAAALWRGATPRGDGIGWHLWWGILVAIAGWRSPPGGPVLVAGMAVLALGVARWRLALRRRQA